MNPQDIPGNHLPWLALAWNCQAQKWYCLCSSEKTYSNDLQETEMAIALYA